MSWLIRDTKTLATMVEHPSDHQASVAQRQKSNHRGVPTKQPPPWQNGRHWTRSRIHAASADLPSHLQRFLNLRFTQINECVRGMNEDRRRYISRCPIFPSLCFRRHSRRHTVRQAEHRTLIGSRCPTSPLRAEPFAQSPSPLCSFLFLDFAATRFALSMCRLAS